MSAGLARLAIHTQTTRPWDLRTCCERYAAAGIAGISVWRHLLDPDRGGVRPSEAAGVITDSGLRVSALVRAGFFVARDGAARQEAIDETRRAIEEAAAIGAEQLVLVVGARPDVPLAHAREMVLRGVAAVADDASAANVRLSIEPLHPMYAADRSCVNTLRTANDLCDLLEHPGIGIALDAYHVWWEPDLADEIARAGRAGRIHGVHLCDWRPELRDPLNDRGLMGDGGIDLAGFIQAADDAGFRGLHEVEVFSEAYWAMDQDAYLRLIIERYEMLESRSRRA